jgi:hypothetical protein
VTLRIYSVPGQEIATLADEEQSWTGSTPRGARVGAGRPFLSTRDERAERNRSARRAQRMIVLR